MTTYENPLLTKKQSKRFLFQFCLNPFWKNVSKNKTSSEPHTSKRVIKKLPVKHSTVSFRRNNRLGGLLLNYLDFILLYSPSQMVNLYIYSPEKVWKKKTLTWGLCPSLIRENIRTPYFASWHYLIDDLFINISSFSVEVKNDYTRTYVPFTLLYFLKRIFRFIKACELKLTFLNPFQQLWSQVKSL